MLKDNTRVLLGALLMFIGQAALGQTPECPIEDGTFKDFSAITFSHHNPNAGAVVLSPVNNEVRAVAAGRILRVFRHSKEEQSVLLMTSDSIFISYKFMPLAKVQEGTVVRRGDIIGYAAKEESGLYELSVSYYMHSESVDPRKIFRCKQ